MKNNCCGNCAYYMTDEDACGNLSDFHHDRSVSEGFCIMQDLFYTVKNNDKACADWMYDKSIERGDNERKANS